MVAQEQPGKPHRVFRWVLLGLPLLVLAGILIWRSLSLPPHYHPPPSGVGSVRTINTANVIYSSKYPERGFAARLKALGGPAPCTASAETDLF